MQYEEGLTVAEAEAREVAAERRYEEAQTLADAAFSACCTLAHLRGVRRTDGAFDADYTGEQAGRAFAVAWALKQARDEAWREVLAACQQHGYTLERERVSA